MSKAAESKSGLEQFAALSALFGIVATLFYAILRVAYVQFYSRAGIDPEDVGLGRTELLSQALAGPLVVLGGYGIYVFAVLAIAAILTRRWRSPQPVRVLVPQLAAAAFAISLVLTLYQVFTSARELADELQEGDAARLSYLRVPLFNIPILEIWALPMEIEWIGEEELPEAFANGTDCMLYLGESDGTAVVYDVRDQQAVRFLRENAIITTKREPELLDRRCVPSEE